MTQIKPDKVIYTNLIDTYINYDTLTTDIPIFGTIAASSATVFSGLIQYSRNNTRADLYVQNLSTGIKRPLSGGPRQSPYSFVSSETCTQGSLYSGNAIVITFTIFNGTGVSINLVSQTLRITAVLSEVPT